MEFFQLELQMWEKWKYRKKRGTKESVSKPIDGGEKRRC
jgi:hypothetical protein